MVATFDTAFHQTMPKENFLYPIPYEYYEKYKIRKYGFHGTSHKFVSQETGKLLGNPNAKMVICHLGNGSSISAVKDGKCQDTSMGFTPLDGVEMGDKLFFIHAMFYKFSLGAPTEIRFKGERKELKLYGFTFKDGYTTAITTDINLHGYCKG